MYGTDQEHHTSFKVTEEQAWNFLIFELRYDADSALNGFMY